ncbi:MAG: hypothetical protein ABGY41_11540, partial [Candidatus Poribacteria bacterium]
MIRLAALFVCLLPITTVQAAEDAPWERVFPSLDNVYAVLWYDPPATWWATSQLQDGTVALLRTEDDGVSWQTVTTGPLIGRYAVSRVDPSVIYRSGLHIERSDDGGVTWAQLWPVELRPWDFQDVSERYVVVSPTHRNRIAYTYSGVNVAARTTYVADLDGEAGDSVMPAASDWIQGGATMWAHPETGTVYWHAGTRVGAVDFADVQFAVSGDWYEQYGGGGLVSDDPETPLWTKYDVYRQSPDVFVVDGRGEPLYT